MSEAHQPNMAEHAQQIADRLYDRASQLPEAETTMFGDGSEQGNRVSVPLDGGRKLHLEKGTQRTFGGDSSYTFMSISGGEPSEKRPIARMGHNQLVGNYAAARKVSWKGMYSSERVVDPAKPSEVLRAVHKAIVSKEKQAQK